MGQEKQAKKKTAVAYLRVSRCRKADEGNSSIAKQREKLQAIKNIVIVKEFADYGIADERSLWRRIWFRLHRKNPAFREMLTYLTKSPTDIVVIPSVDRLSRHKGKVEKMLIQLHEYRCGVVFASHEAISHKRL